MLQFVVNVGRTELGVQFRFAPGSPDELRVLLTEAFVLALVPPLSAFQYLLHNLVIIAVAHMELESAVSRRIAQFLIQFLNY